MATEKRLIDAKSLLRRLCSERDEVNIDTGCDIGYHNGLNMAVSMAINEPTVDAVEVVHGQWIEKPYLLGTTRYCSICGQNYGMPHGVFNYCPNCGAKMDVGNEDG
jgi:hypothetical protein